MAFDPEILSREFSILRTLSSKGPFHYMDNAAMAQIPDCVISAMVEHETTRRSNVKRGIHRLAEAATEAFENARVRIAKYLGVKNSNEIIFTGGTTAGINILALSFGQGLNQDDEILISEMEHHSNIIPWQMLKQRRGVSLRYLPITDDGRLDLERAEEYITEKTRLVAVTHGSNVTGAITDVKTLAGLAHNVGAKLMLDGAQVAPHGPLDLMETGADFYVFSGHKVYGPTGIGILWGRMALLERLPPALGGGEMIREVTIKSTTFEEPPHRFEAGTPPVSQAVGLAEATEWLGSQDIPEIHRHLTGLTERIMEGLISIDNGTDRIRILGPGLRKPRLPLVSFAIRGIHPHDICQFLNDRHGVALRGGYHCAQPLHEMYNLNGSTRASLAAFNNADNVDAFLNGIKDCIRRLG